jgi:O-antigen/teichoic acid export membrane protein
MREALKKLTGESLIYGVGQASGRAVQLLLVPLLTRLLDPQAFAVGDLMMAYSQTAILVMVCGMDGALARFFYQEPDREARIRMASSSLVFRLATGTVVAGLLWLLAAPLAALLVGNAVYAKYVRIGAVTIPFTLLVLFGNDVLRVTFQPGKFVALNITQTILVGACSLWFVWRMHLGVVGVLYGRLLGDAASAAMSMVLVRHTVRPRFSSAALRRMLAYGAPAVPAMFAYGLIASADRFALQRWCSLEAVAVYAVAIKFFAVVAIGVSAFQLAYGPFAFARAQTPDAPRLFARVFAAYVVAACLGALLVAEFAPAILGVLVPASYAGAAWPAAWLAFAAVALGAYTVASIGIGLALRTPLLNWCAGGAALVAISGNALLTPRFGPSGAAVATLLGYVASSVITYGIAQRVHPLPYRGGRLLAVFSLALALALGAQRFAPPGAAGVAVKLGAALVFVAACARLGMWTVRGSVAAERPGDTSRA